MAAKAVIFVNMQFLKCILEVDLYELNFKQLRKIFVECIA